MTNFEMVSYFMEAFGQEIEKTPKMPSKDIINLRDGLIDEEFTELRAAVVEEDLVEIADALTDLLYVIYGAGHAYGLDLDACFKEVHDSNMSKLGDNGKPIKREDGKIMKGKEYFVPDLKTVLKL